MKLVILEFVGVTKFCCFVSGGGRGRVFGFLGSGGGAITSSMVEQRGQGIYSGLCFHGQDTSLKGLPVVFIQATGKNLPKGSLADSELSFGRFSTKNINTFLISASLE